MEDTLFIPELVDGLTDDFKKHLELEGNSRLIFSAPYGFGKTTFLKTFFSEAHQKKHFNGIKYKAVHLFPVNYSVATNEDIFKYLKYDIIEELLTNHDLKLEANEITDKEARTLFAGKNAIKALTTFLSFIPKIGKSVKEGYEAIVKFAEEFQQYKSDLQEDDFSKLSTLVGEKVEAESSLYEYNFYTQLIERLVDQLRQSEDGEECKVLLILDDLDRIDPHHIFRIFNVFAAHLDNKEDKINKFNFDQVIFVCDIKNIRNIFKAKYGADVDFNGYIDKFYSRHIFEFKHSNFVNSVVEKCIKEIVIVLDGRQIVRDFRQEHQFIRNVKYINNVFVDSGAISLRILLKYYSQRLYIHERGLKFDNSDKKIKNINIPVILLLDILIMVFGDVNALLVALSKAESYSNELKKPEDYSEMLGETLVLLGRVDHKFRNGEYSKSFVETYPTNIS